MPVYVTCPHTPFQTTVEVALLQHWQEMRGSIEVRPAFADQSHESLLTEIWFEALRRASNVFDCGYSDHHLFACADADFIVDSASALNRIFQLLKDFKAIFVPYFTRDVHGILKHPFFTGLWFWAMRLERRDLLHLPPQNWLHTIGRPLDVGCGGFYHLIQSGFCKPEEILFIDGKAATAPDRVGWVEYPGLGVHVFNHRNFHQPDYVLEPFGIKISQHVENIQKHLAALTAGAERPPGAPLPAVDPPKAAPGGP